MTMDYLLLGYRPENSSNAITARILSAILLSLSLIIAVGHSAAQSPSFLHLFSSICSNSISPFPVNSKWPEMMNSGRYRIEFRLRTKGFSLLHIKTLNVKRDFQIRRRMGSGEWYQGLISVYRIKLILPIDRMLP